MIKLGNRKFIKALKIHLTIHCYRRLLTLMQVTYLEESLEEMRQKLAAEREELLRERSRCSMAALEVAAQDKAWAARKAAADEEARQGKQYPWLSKHAQRISVNNLLLIFLSRATHKVTEAVLLSVYYMFRRLVGLITVTAFSDQLIPGTYFSAKC